MSIDLIFLQFFSILSIIKSRIDSLLTSKWIDSSLESRPKELTDCSYTSIGLLLSSSSPIVKQHVLVISHTIFKTRSFGRLLSISLSKSFLKWFLLQKSIHKWVKDCNPLKYSSNVCNSELFSRYNLNRSLSKALNFFTSVIKLLNLSKELIRLLTFKAFILRQLWDSCLKQLIIWLMWS